MRHCNRIRPDWGFITVVGQVGSSINTTFTSVKTGLDSVK